MASSSVLASGNDSGLVLSAAAAAAAAARCMGKVPPNPNSTSYSQSNPPPQKKHKQLHHKTNGGSHKVLEDLPEVRQTASDDGYSFVQKPIEVNRNMEFNSGDFVTYDVTASTKSELADLRKRMVLELEQIRNLRDRIELGKLSGTPSSPKPLVKPKKLSGNKRSDPISSDKKISNGSVDRIMDEGLMKECKQIVSKLMKHKCGWVFSTPVDTTSLGLHDYHQIVNQPMDLGTVRSNLTKNVYSSPLAVAADVRLTFNNAMLYNPKAHEVHQWAKMLLSRFEDLFRPIQEKVSLGRREHFNGGGGVGVVEDLQGSSWNHFTTPERVKKPKLSPKARKPEKMQSQSSASTMPKPQPQPSAISSKANSPVLSPSPKTAPPSKPRAPKQPKPKAKDPNKREMSMEEKHKLGFELQSLPQEKLPQLVHIIKKRNEHLAQDGDEIELDIEALDTETLWELDRFVTYWKKMVSKSKRQALMMNNNNHVAADTSTVELDDRDASNGRNDFLKENNDEVGDEGGDIPASNFFSVETEKDELTGLNRGNGEEVLGHDIGNADDGGGGKGQGNGDDEVGHDHGNGSSSSSSSSSSSTGSSSSSGSGTSSGSDDSDADDAQS